MGLLPRSENIIRKICQHFGSLFRLSGPAGFSWIAFFFPWAVCVQIREWPFFYSLFIFSLFDTILSIFFEASTSTASLLSLLTCYWYACMFPYLRYLAAKKNVDEVSKTSSFLIGFVLCLLALTPSLILAFATKTIVA